jgi:predicted acetyltransferase
VPQGTRPFCFSGGAIGSPLFAPPASDWETSTVLVTLHDARDSEDDRAWIRAAYRDYLSELAASHSGVFPMDAQWPAREAELVAAWFRDSASHPFVIMADGRRYGFALVAQRAAWPPTNAEFRMSEFYVAPSMRRRGVGRRAASLLFSRFDGEWEVLEDEGNRDALAFWRRVIGQHTSGRYREVREAGEVRQRFRTSVRPPEPLD